MGVIGKAETTSFLLACTSFLGTALLRQLGSSSHCVMHHVIIETHKRVINPSWPIVWCGGGGVLGRPDDTSQPKPTLISQPGAEKAFELNAKLKNICMILVKLNFCESFLRACDVISALA